jgi:hypothetical protein
MLKLLLLALWPMLIQAQAASLEGQVHYLDQSDSGEQHLVYLSSGRILKLASDQQHMLVALGQALKEERWLLFDIDHERNIQAVTSLDLRPRPKQQLHEKFFNYRPSVFETLKEAQSFMRQMRPNAREDAECYNRAHVWAYEGATRDSVRSMKVWIFFTRSYIRQYNFEWWFHVSPYTFVREKERITERVLDFKFARGPQLMQDWTNIFMRNRARCPVIRKYSIFEQQQGEESCFLMKTNMYYYQPLDIENLEKRGVEKTFWIEWELNNAYRQGFGI